MGAERWTPFTSLRSLQSSRRRRAARRASAATTASCWPPSSAQADGSSAADDVQLGDERVPLTADWPISIDEVFAASERLRAHLVPPPPRLRPPRRAGGRRHPRAPRAPQTPAARRLQGYEPPPRGHGGRPGAA